MADLLLHIHYLPKALPELTHLGRQAGKLVFLRVDYAKYVFLEEADIIVQALDGLLDMLLLILHYVRVRFERLERENVQGLEDELDRIDVAAVVQEQVVHRRVGGAL